MHRENSIFIPTQCNIKILSIFIFFISNSYFQLKSYKQTLTASNN